MAKKEKRNTSSITQIILGIIVLAIIFIVGNNFDLDLLKNLTNDVESNALENVDRKEPNNEVTNVDGNLIIDYIDVGQGDSILIRQGEHAMLIDGGTTECKEELLEYLKSKNITKFDYIIGTHPHEDHIGSLDDVVNEFEFDTIFFPDVSSARVTTKTFENLVLAVANKNMKFTTPVSGKEYSLGEAKFNILAPSSTSYQSLNNYSIVIKLNYGENSFIFTGDAETLSETEILNSYDDIHADVLKLGHHGSTTSSSKKFLNAVSPKYAVISVGKDNTYNHPTKTTMDKMLELNIPVYRTDELGTIECISDGKNITFNTSPGSYDYMGD